MNVRSEMNATIITKITVKRTVTTTGAVQNRHQEEKKEETGEETVQTAADATEKRCMKLNKQKTTVFLQWFFNGYALRRIFLIRVRKRKLFSEYCLIVSLELCNTLVGKWVLGHVLDNCIWNSSNISTC